MLHACTTAINSSRLYPILHTPLTGSRLLSFLSTLQHMNRGKWHFCFDGTTYYNATATLMLIHICTRSTNAILVPKCRRNISVNSVVITRARLSLHLQGPFPIVNEVMCRRGLLLRFVNHSLREGALSRLRLAAAPLHYTHTFINIYNLVACRASCPRVHDDSQN